METKENRESMFLINKAGALFLARRRQEPPPSKGSTYNYFYYLKDRLGGIRIVMNAAGGVVQANNYYPSGVTMAELPRRTDQGVQRYKFGGKELDRSYGLDAYDFEARPYNPVLMRFTGFDPLALKYPAISPFAYCGNNPVNRIDPMGKDIIVLNAPKGASGFGHTGILVGNNKDGWTYISKDGSKWLPMNGPSKYTNTQKTGKIFYSEDDFNKSNYASKFGDGYTQRVKFVTTREQDKKAIDAADNAAKRWYSMLFDNCVDAVSEALEAAGLNPGYTWFGMDNPYAILLLIKARYLTTGFKK